jgi:hemolysin III
MPPTIDPCSFRTHPETRAEELASSVTHAIGAALAATALCVLLVSASRYGDVRRIVTLAVYGATMILLYCASTCFHACRRERIKHWLKVWDHAAIYALIAGTYTPFLLVLVRGGWGWSLFGVLWGLTLFGTIVKVFFVHRWEHVSTAIYVMMGWIGLIAIKPFFDTIPGGALAWILAGGVAYTAGVIFFLWDRLPFNHAIWHLFVMAGSACHFVAILLYVLPVRQI